MFEKAQGKKTTTLDWSAVLAANRRNAKDSRLKRFYSASIDNSTLSLSEVPFVALDFETTGLDPEIDDIVSIGLVPFDLQRVYFRESFHWLVNPRRPLAENAVVIHGITHSELKTAPDLLAILDDLLAAISGKVVVVHYNRIEREFLDKALLDRIGEGIRFPVIDTMMIEASVQRKQAKKFWNRLKSKQSLQLRLLDSRERYGLPSYQAHHALTDALATAELFQAQIAHHFSNHTTLAELWV